MSNINIVQIKATGEQEISVCGYRFSSTPLIFDLSKLKPHVVEVFRQDKRLIIEPYKPVLSLPHADGLMAYELGDSANG